MKLFPIEKKSQKIYETISLFESTTPLIYLEDVNYTNINVSEQKNYLVL
jgi:hypothetical protein